MGVKLFSVSLEEGEISLDDTDNELLVDKLIKHDKINKDSTLASSELLEQKAKLKTEIEAKLQEDHSDEVTDEEISDESSSEETEGEASTEEPTSDEGEKDAETSEDTPDTETKDDSKEESGDQEALESLLKPVKLPYVSLTSLSKPIAMMMNTYRSSLGNYKHKALSLEDLPIQHTKEATTESLENLCKFIDDTISITSQAVSNRQQGLLMLNEKLTLLKANLEQGKLKYTPVKVTDKELLKSLSTETTTDLKKSAQVTINALLSFSNILKSYADCPLEKIADLFMANGFKRGEKSGDCEYIDLLPGFTRLYVSIYEYSNFSSSDIDRTSAWLLETATPRTIDELQELEVCDSSEMVVQLELAIKLIEVTVRTLDNLRNITVSLDVLLKNVKVIIQDIKDGKVATIDIGVINSLFKNLIKHRTMANYGIILDNISILYLTGLVTFSSVGYKL